MTDFTRIAGKTRTNIILREQTKGRQYVISATGPEVNATEIGLFYQNFNQIQNMDYLILSGSLSRGVTPNLYGQLILAGKKECFHRSGYRWKITARINRISADIY